MKAQLPAAFIAAETMPKGKRLKIAKAYKTLQTHLFPGNQISIHLRRSWEPINAVTPILPYIFLYSSQTHCDNQARICL